MLKFRTIPMVLVDGPNVVKGSNFDNWRKIGTLVPTLNVYDARDVDELIILDHRASRAGVEFDLRILRIALGRISAPLSVGGGLKSVDAVADLIDNGADKVVVGSAGARNLGLIGDIAARYGSQAVISTIDVKRSPNGGPECFIDGGKTHLSITPVELAQRYQDAGAGEIMVNSISNDGLMNGFDIDLVAEVADAVTVPVIAAGGAGSIQDFVNLAKSASATAAAAGSIFNFTQITPMDIRSALGLAGVPVRIARSIP